MPRETKLAHAYVCYISAITNVYSQIHERLLTRSTPQVRLKAQFMSKTVHLTFHCTTRGCG